MGRIFAHPFPVCPLCPVRAKAALVLKIPRHKTNAALPRTEPCGETIGAERCGEGDRGKIREVRLWRIFLLPGTLPLGSDS